MERKDFLVEIGTEELPPKALSQLAKAFFTGVRDGLEAHGLLDEQHGEFDWYYSPRRLAVLIEGLPTVTSDQTQERLGPAVQAAFDKSGKPTKAAEGFAASVGTTVEMLERKPTDKGERLAFTIAIPGKATAELLPGIVEDALKKLPIPKRMRWGSGSAEFVRPVQWVVMLFGKDVVDCEIFGVRPGRETFGHRFHSPDPVVLKSPADYRNVLEKTYVRVNDSTNSLATWIGEQVNTAARELGGEALGAEPGSELLDEVAALNEWPVSIVGDIPVRFMELPEEVLIATIEHHQRYFPVRGANGKLLPKFITFANIESKNPDVVRQGNERVVVPRLEDAMFFWNTDRKTKLADRLAKLDNITFEKTLGSYGDKVKRVTLLAEIVADQIGANVAWTKRAAQLAKCDLLTDMVGEFPELQGVMGEYYARRDGEPAEIAQAIREQYLPRFAGDELPATKTGQALAIAEKMDTICGLFSIGQQPSGSKDPFALRRQAIGVLRTIVERKLSIDLVSFIGSATKILVDEGFSFAWTRVTGNQQKILEDVGTAKRENELKIYSFFIDRFRGWTQEKGFDVRIVDGVVAKSAYPLGWQLRIEPISKDRALLSDLIALNKRISKILSQAQEKSIPVRASVDSSLLVEDEEKALFDVIESKGSAIIQKAVLNDFKSAFSLLQEFKVPLASFFDRVMVMTDNRKVCENRIAVLHRAFELFQNVADFSQMQAE